MFKLLVRFRQRVFRAIIWLETLYLNYLKRYRIPIVRILHPLSVTMLLFCIGLFLVYEMVYILPELCSKSGVFYRINCVLAIFLMHNILGNMIYCCLTDTSLMALPKDRQDPLPAEAHLWHLCTHCQMIVPPRAWHCRLCNCCILKRDHHCNVTANCVGHANQRYFVIMLLYLTIGSVVACVYNVVHMWRRHQILGEPLAFLSFSISNNPQPLNNIDAGREYDRNWLIINGCVLKLNVLCTVIAASHLAAQLLMITRGSCFYSIWDRSFDLGLMGNLRMVLGKRMFWTILSPFVNSPLPHNGSQWQQVDGDKKPA